MIKKLAVSAASVLTAAVITAFPMCASAFSVEQIQTEMPDINVFYTSDSGEGDVELMLDNVPLKTTEPQSFFDTGMPACYYLLIDDSGSVTAPQMEATILLVSPAMAASTAVLPAANASSISV